LGARIAQAADLVLLVLALPVFVAADLPIAGWGAAAAIWIAQRAIQLVLQRRADASEDPRVVVLSIAGGAIARGLFTAGGILIAGLALSDRAGLSAAALVLALFSVYFVVSVMRHSFRTAPLPPPGKRPRR
jgi:hypothetical protein